MILVDSYGWLEMLKGTELGEAYRPALAQPDHLIVPTICIAEVAQTLLRHHSDPDVLRAVAHMLHCRLVPLDANLAIEAARVGNALRLAYPENVIFAIAHAVGAEVWTHCDRYPAGPPVRMVASE